MRTFSKLIAAATLAGAAAVFGLGGAASAATYPTAGGIHVDKGDVQTLYNFNNGQMQDLWDAGKVHFLGADSLVIHQHTPEANRADGTVGWWDVDHITTYGYNASAHSSTANKVTYWTLSGVNYNFAVSSSVDLNSATLFGGSANWAPADWSLYHPTYEIERNAGPGVLQVSIDGYGTKTLTVTPAS